MLAPAAAPVRQSSVRAHNLALVLRLLAESPDPISRAAVAAATGLTRATVSALVDDLVSGGVNLLDVDTIVLGGSYAPLLPWLRTGVEAELRRRVLTARLAPVAVRAAALGADAATRGAADAVIRSVRDDPAAWLSRTGRL